MFNKSIFSVLFFAVLLAIGSNAFARGGGGHGSARSSRSSSSKAYRTGSSIFVHGYTKKNGTYVKPHHRTRPNKTKKDNWSTKGNVNPYTGKKGTKSPD
jgi:hypothetical protein